MCKGKNCENLVGNEIGKITAPSNHCVSEKYI